jgi:hypothetical protein
VKLVALAFTRSLAALRWTLPPALLAAWFGIRAATNAAAVAPWLHAALFVTVLAAAAAAMEAWPLFARGRPGSPWLARLRPGPLGGCGAITAGALAALVPCLVLIGALGAFVVPNVPAPRAHVTLVCTSPRLVLAGDQTSLLFAGPGALPVDELQLRPRAFVPVADPVPVVLQVLADGAPLGTPITVSDTERLQRLRFPARHIQQVELRRTAGNLLLAFPADSLIAVGARVHDGRVNLALAALLYLLPAFLALAAATVGAVALSLPVNLTTLLAVLIVLTLGDVLPTGMAVDAALRGRWLLDGALFQACLPSLAAGFLAMIVGMILRARSGP